MNCFICFTYLSFIEVRVRSGDHLLLETKAPKASEAPGRQACAARRGSLRDLVDRLSRARWPKIRKTIMKLSNYQE